MTSSQTVEILGLDFALCSESVSLHIHVFKIYPLIYTEDLGNIFIAEYI